MNNITVKTLFIITLLTPMLSFASGAIKKPSSYSVQETMDKFETLVKSKGMGVFARVDHTKNATGVEMTMNAAQVLIFGNPKGGTILMKDDPATSLDLPLRVAVYEDNDGNVWISYHNPQALKNGYAITNGSKVLDKVEAALDKLTTAVTK